MMPTDGSRKTLRFGDYDLDIAAYELRRRGRPVKLGRQPMDLLILLVQSRGQLVSRSDIVDRLWAKDVFVDVETGVNTIISRIRQALRDSADAPVFLETVPGKGYRFTAKVDVVAGSGTSAPPVPEPLSAIAPIGDAVSERLVEPPHAILLPGRGRVMRVGLWIGVVVVVVGIAIGALSLLKGGAVAAAPAVSLAVLPFENLGGNPEHAYLAAGLTDETSASLAQIDPAHLSVKGRTLRYKASTKTAAEIGQELSVDYLVESSIRAEGTRLRVTVTLIRVKDQAHVWSQLYDREPTSLLGFEQELSAAIAEQVRLRLSPDRMNGLGHRQTQNADAYDAYLRARYQAHRRTADGNARAIELYKQAIAIDGTYALAWSELSFTYASAAINGDARPADVGPRAHAASLRAVAENAGLPNAQLALGYNFWMIDWNWKDAEPALRLAIELDPSDAAAHRIFGHALSQAGRQREAEAAMRRARELDPLDALCRALSAQVAFQGREIPAAIEHSRRAISLDPGFWIGYLELAQAYEGAGDHALALEALADAERLSAGNSKGIGLRGYILAKMGRPEAAREALRSLDVLAHDRYVPPYAKALIYAGLGDRDAMFDALDAALAARDVHLMYLPVDMKWDPYRADPRFVAVVAGYSPAPQR